MKKFLAVAGLLALLAGTTQAQSDIIIRERAKQLRDQNNARQGVPPAAPAATPAKPATPAPAATMTPAQAGLARLQTDLAAIKTNSTVTAEQQQRIATDLTAVAQGANRPSSQNISKLAANLAAGLTQKSLTPGERSRLLQNLNAILNGASLSKDRTQDVIDDIEKLFKGSDHAAAIAGDVKTITAEVQKTAAR